MSRTATVVVSYGSHRLLRDTLPAAAEQGTDEVVVVDNYSGEAERAAVRALAAERGWSLEEPPTNLGFGGGVNLGVAAAVDRGAQVVVVVNPDARLLPDDARRLVAAVESRPDALVAPRIVRPDGRVWFRGARLDLRTGRTAAADGVGPGVPEPWLTGACLAFHAHRWTRVGGFDDDYFLYWEDVDLSYRWRRDGGPLVLLPEVTVVHAVGGTQVPGDKSAAYVYFNCRNRLLFAARHLPRRAAARWALGSPGYAVEVVSRAGRRALLRPTRVWPAVRGTAAGLRALTFARTTKEMAR